MCSPAAVPHLRHLSVSPVVMRVLAVLLGLHGVAHLAGTADAFTKASDGQSVDDLAGAWTLSDLTLLRAVGMSRRQVRRSTIGSLCSWKKSICSRPGSVPAGRWWTTSAWAWTSAAMNWR